MKIVQVLWLFALGSIVVGQQPMASPTPGSVDELVGLWAAKKRFGPDAHGTLIIRAKGTNFSADMMGRPIPVRKEKGELTFELPNNQGVFRGRLEARNIHGHWFQPGTVVNGGDPSVFVEATPLDLYLEGPGRWRGVVEP